MKTLQNKPLRIVMVAGELSGDILGAGLIRAVKARYPNARFEGIGGPRMLAEGFETRWPMERLAVMGLVEVLGRIRELLKIRKDIRQFCLKNPPDVFIGIDAPDFTLPLEKQLRAAGIPTVHYVSPSVWAWRQGRVHGIARSTDLMLTLLPFEARFYEAHSVPVRFVGHPLANEIPLEINPLAARESLDILPQARVVALLPGSRGNEVKLLGESFIRAATLLAERHPDLVFLIPAANRERREQLQDLLANAPERVKFRLIDGRSRDVMTASDIVVLASGTAALEAMLLKRPMVVAYRVAGLTYQIAKRLVKTPYFSLPNLLAGQALVPELIQHEATPQRIAAEVLQRLENPEQVRQLQERFTQLHQQLRLDASERAAEAVLELIKGSGIQVTNSVQSTVDS